MKSLVKYLEESFALKVELKKLPREAVGKLPLYLKSSYTFYDGHLQNRHIIFAEPEQDLEFTPDQRQKQGQILKSVFQLPIVFILNDLEPWERKRLIGRNIAFVQPGKQLYLPEFYLDLSDVKLSYRSAPEKTDQLSYRAQLTLLYHLEVGDIENMPLQQVAEVLDYSAMNVSRIVKELEQHQLITLSGNKGKRVSFLQSDKKELWSLTEQLMRSPVREVLYLDEKQKERPELLLSYDTALAHYSMLNEGKHRSYAIGRDQFRNLVAHGQITPNAQYGEARLEVWQYNPWLLSKTGQVDPLSLYLGMRDESDERIKISLEDMINNIKW